MIHGPPAEAVGIASSKRDCREGEPIRLFVSSRCSWRPPRSSHASSRRLSLLPPERSPPLPAWSLQLRLSVVVLGFILKLFFNTLFHCLRKDPATPTPHIALTSQPSHKTKNDQSAPVHLYSHRKIYNSKSHFQLDGLKLSL